MRYCSKTTTIKLTYEKETKCNINNKCSLQFMENLSLLIRYHKICRSYQYKLGLFSWNISVKYRNIVTFLNVSLSSWTNLANRRWAVRSAVLDSYLVLFRSPKCKLGNTFSQGCQTHFSSGATSGEFNLKLAGPMYNTLVISNDNVQLLS